jgi:peptidyl-prolyl cis-trans isomerase SurA
MIHSFATSHLRPFAIASVLAAVLLLPVAAQAQVAVIANGSPITELDIQQRTKLMTESTHKAPPRQQVIDELINDRLKIGKAKTYGFELPEKDVEAAYKTMATRQHLTPQQFDQVLQHAGVSPSALKARLRAELTWNELIRGKFSASLQVSETDITNVLGTSGQPTDAEGYVYKLYPVVVLAPGGLSAANADAKHQEAENLRNRFTSCAEGLPLARALRDVAVRQPVTRSSGDLPQTTRELLAKLEVGRLSQPEVTAQGLEMFALCDKKESKTDSPAKTEARQQIFGKKFDAESKRFLDEIRKQAMIEYRR